MPIYYFHMTEGDEFLPDQDGIEQDDLATACQAASEGARSLMAEAVKTGKSDFSGRFDVEDEHGATACTLTFACSVQMDIMP